MKNNVHPKIKPCHKTFIKYHFIINFNTTYSAKKYHEPYLKHFLNDVVWFQIRQPHNKISIISCGHNLSPLSSGTFLSSSWCNWFGLVSILSTLIITKKIHNNSTMTRDSLYVHMKIALSAALFFPCLDSDFLFINDSFLLKK